jgi:hypothetical protein
MGRAKGPVQRADGNDGSHYSSTLAQPRTAGHSCTFDLSWVSATPESGGS